jgi:hypothetical protein
MRQFTLGEVLSVIRGECWSREDPLGKDLIQYLSGEPAFEGTILHGDRPRLCSEFLAKQFPKFAQHTHEEIMAMSEQGLLEESLVNVPPYENFPQP